MFCLRVDYWLFDYLYIVFVYQGKGIGVVVLCEILVEVDEYWMFVYVGVLCGSDLNCFYEWYGFV